MERLGAVLRRLVSTEVITVAEADRLWEAAWGDLRDVEALSQGAPIGVHSARAGGVLGEPTP